MKKNLRKTLALFLVMTMSFALLSACRGNPAAPSDAGGSQAPTGSSQAPGNGARQSATLATSGEPTRFFPCGAEGSNGNDYLVLNNIYDTLVFLDADGALKPCLAETWSVSEDGLCYTFNLREGVKFHDGSAMTAEDAITSAIAVN